MAKSAGNTIVVAGGGGSGGGGSGGSKDGGGGSGISTNPRSKDPLNSKLKLDDQMFWTLMAGAAGIGLVVHLYNTNPQMFHGFIDPLRDMISGQPSIPAAPPGTTQNDTIPQSSDTMAPSPTQGQWGGEMQYPQYPQQATGQEQFQFPQQQMQSQPYQGYDPGMQFGGGGDMSTSFNPTFGQNSNQSFRTYVKKYDFDSADGMLKVSNAYFVS